MAKHELCRPEECFTDGDIDQKTFLVLEARRIVLWAGALIQPDEEIGGIGVQLDRAARLLQLHPGVIWRAYQKRSGPAIFPTIERARNMLLERITKSPWNQLGPAFPHLQACVGYQPRSHAPSEPIETCGGRIRRCG